MRRIFPLLGLSILTSNALASEYLEPEDSVYSQPGFYLDFAKYDQNLADAFHEVFDARDSARVIVAPSFRPEYGVAVMESHGSPEILLLTAETQIWQFEVLAMLRSGQIRSTTLDGRPRNDEEIAELESRLPPRVEDVIVSRCELNIDPLTAKTLKTLWREMLRRTQYPKEPGFGADGITYHFSMTLDNQSMAGKTWSPDITTNTGKMVEVIELLKDACTQKDIGPAKRAEDIARKLLESLNAEN